MAYVERREVRIRNYSVVARCDHQPNPSVQVVCGGEFKFTGRSQLGGITPHEHRCMLCGRTQQLNRIYPNIESVEEELPVG